VSIAALELRWKRIQDEKGLLASLSTKLAY